MEARVTIGGICLPDWGGIHTAYPMGPRQTASIHPARGAFPLRSMELEPDRLAHLLHLGGCAEKQLPPFSELQSENRPIRLLDLKK